MAAASVRNLAAVFGVFRESEFDTTAFMSTHRRAKKVMCLARCDRQPALAGDAPIGM